MMKFSKNYFLFCLSLSIGIFTLFSPLSKPTQVCAAQWGSCASGDRRYCPSNGEAISGCIDSVDIVGYVYDTVNVPPGTKVTMYIGQTSNSCSDVTCLLRHDDASTTWNGTATTIDISTIGCSSGACRIDGRDWIDVTFNLSKSGWSASGCRAEMAARDGGSWFEAQNQSEMRGRMDITGENNFWREINVKFICPAVAVPTPTPTPRPAPTNTPLPGVTNTPVPTRVPTATPTLAPGVTRQPTPTPSTCPIPGQVLNVHVTCPNCSP